MVLIKTKANLAQFQWNFQLELSLAIGIVNLCRTICVQIYNITENHFKDRTDNKKVEIPGKLNISFI